MWAPYQLGRHLTRYAEARRQHFGKDHIIHYNVSVDAARRGAVSRMFGFISDKDSIGAWLNPTVPKNR